jgi:microcystin-dependent protein
MRKMRAVRAVAIAALCWSVFSFQSAGAFSDQETFGGTSTGSVTGSTTSYAITIPNLSANPTGVVLRFIPNITSVGPTQINVSGIGLVNVLRPSSIGLVAFSGGEFQVGEPTSVMFNGTAYVLTSNVDMTRIGDTVQFRGSAAPRGTLIEDGSCVSQTTFAALFSVIGTSYGSCSAGLFALPDSRGTAFVALDGQGANGLAGRITTASCATPNAVGLCGHETATLTLAQLPTGITSAGTASVASTINDIVQSIGGLPVVSVNQSSVTAYQLLANGGGSTSGVASTGSASVTSNNTSGAAHPVLNPSSFGRRAIKY